MKSLDDIFPECDAELGDAYLRGPDAVFRLKQRRGIPESTPIYAPAIIAGHLVPPGEDAHAITTYYMAQDA